jgi:Cu+-exporting ATPase
MQSVIDPVCGMVIDSETAAARTTYEGQEYFFCSIECKRQFDQNPETYRRETVVAHRAPRADDPPFTKTGPFVTPKFGAAGSGGAEYEPLPGDNPDAA